MIHIVLSERDFDYELQALVGSFFPGQKSCVVIQQENMPITREVLQKYDGPAIGIVFRREEIVISFVCGDIWMQRKAGVSGKEDWHKHEDKSSHPYRAYYKNVLKRLLFLMLCEGKEEKWSEGVVMQIPAWGTMTGVRPTKLPMQELLQGKTEKQVEEDLREWYCCSEEKLRLCLSIARREAELIRGKEVQACCSLYIGIPFCPTTCLYCSFPSYPLQQFGHLKETYLQALKKEIKAVAAQARGRRLNSIYVGGGTPTALDAEQLKELLACVRQYFPQGESCEFTVEAGRPDSITAEKLGILRDYGVTRISINPQTMRQETLERIGREHTVQDTKQAFQAARELGFTDINMDVIVGLPEETTEDFADTLEQIGQLDPDSLTVHSLVIKRASGLRGMLESSGDFAAEEELRGCRMEQMLKMAQTFAREKGYRPYYMYRQKNSAGHFGSSGQENIGFARKGKECLYNILIMEELQTILAVGAGASTKIYHPEKKIVSRIENVKSITDYISRIDEMIERKKGILC